MQHPSRNAISIFMSLFALLVSGFAQATAEDDRARFLAAEKAWREGSPDYTALKESLREYPLYPYLEYQEVLSAMPTGDGRQRVEAFMQRHPDTALAELLNRKWLFYLARNNRWKEFLEAYQGSSWISLKCHYLTAELRQGDRGKALKQAEEIWLHGKSRPKECDTILQAFTRSPLLSRERVWQRIGLAMEKRQFSLARYLRRFLPQQEHAWVDLWIDVYSNPRLILSHKLFRSDHDQRDEMLLYGLRRLIGKWPAEATRAWQTLAARHPTLRQAEQEITRLIAIAAADSDLPDARQKLDEATPQSADADDPLFRARLLYGLRKNLWQQTVAWIRAMPETARTEDLWRYWLARALAESGQKEASRELFRELAKERSFYGFLAAEQIGQDYQLGNQPLQLDRKLLQKIAALPATRRMQELYHLRRITDATREWRKLQDNRDTEELKAIGRILHDLGWQQKTISTLAKAGSWDDLEMRFPVSYQNAIRSNLKDKTIDLAWVLGLIRQESAYNPHAVSHAGARGLMQLMPGTAVYIAKKSGHRKPQVADLVEPELNIKLGTAYLDLVHRQLNQHPVLATAAYNAGPGRVKSWLPDSAMAADIWIESIPFHETREYVKRVMTYSIIYNYRLGQPGIKLSRRLRPIGEPNASLSGLPPRHQG